MSPRLAELEAGFRKSGGAFKLFKIGDVFDIQKGERLTKADMQPGGVNFLGAISTNNGIRQKINAPRIWEPNCISVNYNGSVGCSYYQEDPFYASDDVNLCYAKSWWNLTRERALYFCALLQKQSLKFSYSQKWTIERMRGTSLLLPVVASGNIAFSYMEQYVAELEAERVAELEAYFKITSSEEVALGVSCKSCLSFNENPYLVELNAEFRKGGGIFRQINLCGIEGIFDVKNTHCVLKESIKQTGPYPYVTASEGDNSVVGYIDYDHTQIEPGHSIMIGGKTLVITYQENDYFSNDSHNLWLQVKGQKCLSRYIELYLVAALFKSLGPKYSWGNSISFTKIQRDIVSLPVTASGVLAFDYMERYMAELEAERMMKLEAYIKATKQSLKEIVGEFSVPMASYSELKGAGKFAEAAYRKPHGGNL